MKVEMELTKKQRQEIIIEFVEKCTDEDLSWLFLILKSQTASRIAHVVEGYEKYWKQAK